MKSIKKLVIGAALAGISLTGTSAMAAHVGGLGFSEQEFTFDGTAFGGSNTGPVKFIDFSYRGEIDQDGGGNFSETGGGFFASFRATLGSPPILGGIGSAFDLYLLFETTGTTAANGAGIDVTFNTFEISYYIDQNRDTAFVTPTTGGADESITFATTANTADDVLILSGTHIVGGAHVFPGLAGGDFDEEFLVTFFDAAVWGGDAFSGAPITGDVNGVNTQIAGITGPNDPVTDAFIVGSGNSSFVSVPEPTTLALLSAGLIGLGGISRRRTK